jgi:hypothetical protein
LLYLRWQPLLKQLLQTIGLFLLQALILMEITDIRQILAMLIKFSKRMVYLKIKSFIWLMTTLLILHTIHSQDKFSINQAQLELQAKTSMQDVKLTIVDQRPLQLLFLQFFKEMKPKQEDRSLNQTRIQKYFSSLLIMEHLDLLQCQ